MVSALRVGSQPLQPPSGALQRHQFTKEETKAQRATIDWPKLTAWERQGRSPNQLGVLLPNMVLSTLMQLLALQLQPLLGGFKKSM